MPGSRVGHHDEWPTLGWEVIDWIEAYLCHGPGDVEGEPLILDDEWAQFVLDCYRLFPKGHDRAGQRIVTRAVLSRPKGRAKSELAGAITCAEAQAPVRFDGWRKNGDPVGRPVRSPFIRCLATEESQAGNTYDNVTVMLEHASEHHHEQFGRIDIGKSTQASTRIYLPGGGEIRPSTASSAAKDGGKETFAVADETHLYVLRELKAMHRMVSRNLRKRKLAEPWMLDTTTAHQLGQESIAEGACDRAEQLLDGRRVRAGGFYWNHREGLDVRDWEDDDEVLAALIEAYGEAAGWVDLQRIVSDDIRSPEATEPESRRYWLNQARAGVDKAFDLEQWRTLARPTATIAKSELVTVGFDGSRRDDSTGIVVTHVASGLQVMFAVWEKEPDATDAWEVPEAEVDEAMSAVFDYWDVWRLYADPPWWESTIDKWAGRWGEKRVVSWWTNRRKAMALALRAFRNSMAVGELTHDDDPAYSRHIGNARRVVHQGMRDDDGTQLWTIAKDRPDSPHKIDLDIAGCLSWEARGDAIAAGVLEEEEVGELVTF